MSDVDSREKLLNIPNIITGARIIGSITESFQYARTGKIRHFIRAGGWFITDAIDGAAARLLNQETRAGYFLDHIGDKLSFLTLAAAATYRGDVDQLVLAAVAGVNASNTAATIVDKFKHQSTGSVPPVGKISQFKMNMGFGLNTIGKHLARSEDADLLEKTAGQLIRYGGAALAVSSAFNEGAEASSFYWKRALQPADIEAGTIQTIYIPVPEIDL